MIDLINSTFGQYKIPIAWLLAFGVMATAIHTMADSHYMLLGAAEAADQELEDKIELSHKALAEKIERNSKLLLSHIQQYHINENRKAIELVEDQFFELEQYEKLSGPSQMTETRRHELERKLDALQEERECLRAGRADCD